LVKAGPSATILTVAAAQISTIAKMANRKALLTTLKTLVEANIMQSKKYCNQLGEEGVGLQRRPTL
jgi:hypothetical protein